MAARHRLTDRSGELPVLHVLYGPDEFRASEALAELKQALDPDGALATNTTQLSARGLTPEHLIQHASAIPFLGQARLVVVEGLLSALGNRRGVVDQWQPLLDFVPVMPETSHVVLIEPPPRRPGSRDGPDIARSPLLRALRDLPGVTVTAFNELRPYGRGGEPSEVTLWLRERAKRRGVQIEPRAVEALVELIGSNLRMLDAELAKLATYAGARPIAESDVRELTPQAREESIFALVDAVVERRAAVALRALRRILEDGSQPPPVVQAMIARQVRHLVRATELLESRADEDAIAEATGVRRGFALRKLMRQARGTSRVDAELALREIELADQRVKTGRLSDVLALELLVVRLASRQRGASVDAGARPSRATPPARRGSAV